MIIAVDASPLINKENKRDKYPLLDTILFLAAKKPAHRFIIIRDGQLPEIYPALANVEIITHDALAKKGILGHYWSGVKLKTIIRKIKADVLIGFKKTNSMPVPQLLISDESKKWNKRAINKADLIIVNSAVQKKQLIEKFDVAAEKIEVVPPVVAQSYKKIQGAEKDSVKAGYTEGREFFICTTDKLDEKSFLKQLKSFSHFKKRLQSSMKLVLLAKPGAKLIHQLSSYKYRNDLVFPEQLSEAEEAALIASSYAVIIEATESRPFINTLKAMKCNVPVISTKNSATNELAGDAVLFAEATSEKGVGEKMIQLYTDENLRSRLINKGAGIADGFTQQKAMDCLWNCINRAVK